MTCSAQCQAGRLLLAALIFLLFPSQSLQRLVIHHQYGGAWDRRGNMTLTEIKKLVRQGRKLCADQTPMDMLGYWQQVYGNWSTEKYQEVLQQVQQLPNITEAVANDSVFLQVYYLLRSNTEVHPAANWQKEHSKCRAACTDWGTCDEELGLCHCPRGRQGPDCSQHLDIDCGRDLCLRENCRSIQRERCINMCNRRGSCVSQTCHCFPGYFGADCSLSLNGSGKAVLLEGLGYALNPRGPKVYVYELPPLQNTWRLIWLDRPLNIMVWERLLSGRYRVADPAEADYFFIPTPGRGCANWDAIVAFLQEHFSTYLHRKDGKDHIMSHAGDWGRCEVPKSYIQALPYIANFTMLQHWGITTDRSGTLNHNGFNACYVPNQDILMPPINGDMYATLFETNPWHPEGKLKHPMAKKQLAFMAGGICGWNSPLEPPCPHKHYSLRVREQLWGLYHGKPGFLVEKQVPDMAQAAHESDFCFAPIGAGYGKRGAMAAVLGCIPVTISDDIHQGFQPFLDWNDFGVWIAEKDINRTEEILKAFTPEDLAQKRERLACAAKHIAYTTVSGNVFENDTGEFDAMNTLVEILRARLRHPGMSDVDILKEDQVTAEFMACHRSSSGPGMSSMMEGVPGVSNEPLCYFFRPRYWEKKKDLPDTNCIPVQGRVFHPGASVTCPLDADLLKCRIY